MQTPVDDASQLWQEKQGLFAELLGLTREDAGALSAGKLLALLGEREALMARVTAIDTQLAKLQAAPPPLLVAEALDRSVNELIARNGSLLDAASARREALLDRLLG